MVCRFFIWPYVEKDTLVYTSQALFHAADSVAFLEGKKKLNIILFNSFTEFRLTISTVMIFLFALLQN